MAEKIQENLWRLEIPLVGNPLKNMNSYLITGDRNLLIDTGFREDPCREAMDRQLRELGVDLGKTDIFLTHLHSDHSGLSTELHRPGCRILISEMDGKSLITHGSNVYWRAKCDNAVRDGFSQEEMERLWGTNPARESAPEIFSDYTYLYGGEELNYGGYRLHCLLTPGHTPGHLCLYDAEKKLLFSGDHVLFRITSNICRWTEMPDALGSYLESLKKIRSLPVKTILPGHRREAGNFCTRVDELRAHHVCRIAETLRIVREQPGLNAYQIAGNMTWNIPCSGWAEFPLLQKYFAVGETLSHLDYLEIRGEVARITRKGKNIYCVRARG